MTRSSLNPLTVGLVGAALLSAVAGLVTAQEAQPPAVQTPPEETAPQGEPPAATPDATPDQAPEDGESAPPAGVPDPAPYTVLGPDSRRAAEEADAPPPVAEAPLEEVLPEIVEAPPVDPGPPPPLPRRPRHPGAIVQVLDKVTAETLRFEVGAGRPVRWKSLVFKANACETQAANEPLQESTAHLLVTSEPRAKRGRAAPEAAQVFRGWMFASSPGLNPFEHPVYDVWLVGCRMPVAATPVPVPAPGQTGTPPPAARPGSPATTAARTTTPAA